jgi:Mlc titration factor MtfA (ptsG expression regulator)
MTPVLALTIIAVVAIGVAVYKKPLKKVKLPADYKNMLEEHVAFYRSLNVAEKTRFEEKIREFLGYIRIHGVKTTVEDLDKLLVASSGVIPIFGFPEWRYYNLRDVLLYGDSFDQEDFSTTSIERDTLGMVGTGPMQMMMILSKPALREGFGNPSGKENVGIHEFVHLLDKEDGSVDGLPQALLDKKYTVPWLNFMADSMHQIRIGNSDINIYGAKNEAEFFAVAAEYFFGRPDLFKERHPDLYNLMTKIFNQQPADR